MFALAPKSMCYSKFTGNAQRRICLKSTVHRTIHNNIWKIVDVPSMWGSLRLAPMIASLFKPFAEECMYFSLDSVPDKQLTLGGAWMDDSDEENSPEP